MRILDKGSSGRSKARLSPWRPEQVTPLAPDADLFLPSPSVRRAVSEIGGENQLLGCCCSSRLAAIGCVPGNLRRHLVRWLGLRRRGQVFGGFDLFALSQAPRNVRFAL